MPKPDPISRSVYQSRTEQVLAHLRQCLEEGLWTGSLPAERQLAAQLGVGRNTVRAAIQKLRQEGLVRERSPRGTLLATEAPAPKRRASSVGIIFNSPAQHLIGKELIYFGEIQSFLADKGIELTAYHTTYPPRSVSPGFRKIIASGASHALWILLSPSEATERWCIENRVPAMLVGAGMKGGLPGIAIDIYACCRHAVGQLLAKGHRRVAMLLPVNEKGEDYHARRGFLDAVEESPHRSEITARIEVHQTTKASVCQSIARLLALKERPTALLICRTGHYITAHSYLLKRGIDVPGDISLISRDHDLFLGDLVPEPSRYEIDRPRLARAAARLAYRLVEFRISPHSPKSMIRIPPDFVKGETLAAVAR